MLINCTLPAINYSTCCGGEANVLMHHNMFITSRPGGMAGLACTLFVQRKKQLQNFL